jgi:hypothetical protein
MKTSVRATVNYEVRTNADRLREDYACDWKILGVIFEVIEVQVSVLRSVARGRLVEAENPSACATVNWNVCKSAIALYGQC